MKQQRLFNMLTLSRRVLVMAQNIRIQQVGAAKDAKWPQNLRDRADASWLELNKCSEELEGMIEKMMETANKGTPDGIRYEY